MTISGFTMVRNATKLYYPVKAAIESILPIVDEFVIALGDCDADDTTEQEIASINSDKIKIIHTVWDVKKYSNGTEYARQTDIAKGLCKGDWLFYIQSDEVLHEKYLPVIKKRCEELLDDKTVEGLLFNYRHFWGDYDHYIVSHAWYPKEIRIIRNDKDIHSWRDAQSFRRIPNFDGVNYAQKKNTSKLKVAKVDAWMYHYGFVRPPELMIKKTKTITPFYHGEQPAQQTPDESSDIFNYGNLGKLKVFKNSHPAVMKEYIEKFNWRHLLHPQYKSKQKSSNKHEKLKYRMLTFIEQNLLGGTTIGGFKNYKLVRRR